MKLKLVLLTCILSVSLTGCLNDKKADVNPALKKGENTTQVVPAQVGAYALDDVERLFKAQGIELSGAGNSNEDWILNGVKPSNYYYSCGPASDCKKPQEHISIYIFKDAKAREEGFTDFYKQKEKHDMIVPLVWQNANALVLYWHSTSLNKKPVFEDEIRKALNGWNAAEDVLKIRLVCAEQCKQMEKPPFQEKVINDANEVYTFTQAITKAEPLKGVLKYVAVYKVYMSFKGGTEKQYVLNITDKQNETALLVDLEKSDQGYSIPKKNADELRAIIYKI